jgi:hypothetical protein
MMNDLTPDEAGFPISPKTPNSPITPGYKRSPESPRSPDSPRTPISRSSRFLDIPNSTRSLLEEFNRTSWSVKQAKKARCNC